MLARAGLTPREALSTRSRAYRDLGLAARDVSDDELLDLMVAEPTLLKRPLVVTPAGSVLGYKKAELERLTYSG